MDLDTLQKIIALGTSHQWLLLAVVVIGWLTAMTSDWSKFPITVSGRWQSAVAAGLGLAFGVLTNIQNGMDWKKALQAGAIAAATTGFLYDLVIKGICDGKVPPWLAWLALAKDPKNTSVKPPPPSEVTPIDVPKNPPPSGLSKLVFHPDGRIVFLTGFFMLAVGLVGSAAQAGIDAAECALAHIDQPDDAIVRDCFDHAPSQLSPEERQKIIATVHEQRAVRARLAVASHAQGFDEARAKLGACQPGLASDAGAAKDGGAK